MFGGIWAGAIRTGEVGGGGEDSFVTPGLGGDSTEERCRDADGGSEGDGDSRVDGRGSGRVRDESEEAVDEARCPEKGGEAEGGGFRRERESDGGGEKEEQSLRAQGKEGEAVDSGKKEEQA